MKTITTTYNTPLMFTGLRSVVECQHRFAPISSVISRSFSNSGAPLSSTLSNILLKEIDYEKQNYSQPEVGKIMALHSCINKAVPGGRSGCRIVYHSSFVYRAVMFVAGTRWRTTVAIHINRNARGLVNDAYTPIWS